MKDLTPPRATLDPIEIASRDEITALQTERLKWSLRHAYDNVPFYKAGFEAAGVHPDDLKTVSDLAKFPFTQKTDLRAQLPFRHVRRAARPDRPDPCLLRHHRPAHRGRLHPGRSCPLGAGGGALAAGGRNAAGRSSAQRLWLRPLHRRPRHPARRRCAGARHRAGLGRHDRAAGPADHRFPTQGNHRHAVLCALHPRSNSRPRASTRAARRSRSASSARNPGPMPCGRRSRRLSTCMRSTSTASLR